MKITKFIKKSAAGENPGLDPYIRQYFIEKGASEYYEGMQKEAALSDRRAESIAESAVSRISRYNPRLNIEIPAETTEDEDRAIVEFVKQNAGFGVRHPVISGIPTLGIWPAISRENLELRAGKHLLKRHPEVSQRMKEDEQREIDNIQKAQEVLKTKEQEASKKERTQHITGGALDAVGIIANAIKTRRGEPTDADHVFY